MPLLLAAQLSCAARADSTASPPAAAPGTVSAVSSASRFVDWAANKPGSPKKLRVGIVAFVRPAPNEEILEATVETLRKDFGSDFVEVKHYTLPQLAYAIQQGAIDIFMSSSGFYVRMTPYGARDLATAVSADYPNPNHSDGSAIIVLDRRRDLLRLADLKGSDLVTSTPTAFTGLQVPLGEFIRHNISPDGLFKSIHYLGGDAGMNAALPMLKSGEADVGIFRLCFLEEWLAKHPEDKGVFRVVNRMDSPEHPERCMRSTSLYPAWTVATTKTTDPTLSRWVTRSLLQMKPLGDNRLAWGVATDYSSVSELFKALKIGPYEYLQHWTVQRILDEYGPFVMLACVLIIGLFLHAVRVTQLVRKRTADLTAALAKQKALEQEAKQAETRLENISRIGIVGQLSTIFAHEMRQPLGAISLYSYALKKLASAGAVPAEKARTILAKLDQQTERANDIVTRVRTYARSEATKTERFALGDAVERAVADLKSAGRYKASVVFGPMERAEIEADPLEIEIVAVNLIKNALQALDGQPGGRVIVSVTTEGAHALLCVMDNGFPISDEAYEALAAGRGESTKHHGPGLGLLIVRNILEKLGGRINYIRMPESGLAAVASIPLARAAAASESASAGSQMADVPSPTGASSKQETSS